MTEVISPEPKPSLDLQNIQFEQFYLLRSVLTGVLSPKPKPSLDLQNIQFEQFYLLRSIPNRSNIS